MRLCSVIAPPEGAIMTFMGEREHVAIIRTVIVSIDFDIVIKFKFRLNPGRLFLFEAIDAFQVSEFSLRSQV